MLKRTKKATPTKTAKAKTTKPRTKKVTVQPTDWVVYWVRTINGEEYVAKGKMLEDGVLLVDPTMLTYLSGNLVLAPYGIMADEIDGVRPFFFPAHAILHVNDASEQIQNLYEVSLETSMEYVETHFASLVDKSLKTLVGAIAEGMREPSASELDELEKILSGGSIDIEQPQRSKSQTIDDLVKLANAKGKGKTVG
jgi:hypothetical protein